MNEKISVIANIGAAVTMLVSAISWLVFGGQASGLALCIGATVGIFVFTTLSYQAFRHHSYQQARDENGRFVPVKERGKIVQWVLIDEKTGKNGGKTSKDTHNSGVGG